jgi:hypothetical protein
MNLTALFLIASLAAAPAVARPPASPLRDSISRMTVAPAPRSPVGVVAAPAPPRRSPHQQTIGEKIAGAVFGGALGFFVGGFVGYKLDRAKGCGCDDPGLRGILFGAPIGAVAGAILGAKVLFR